MTKDAFPTLDEMLDRGEATARDWYDHSPRDILPPTFIGITGDRAAVEIVTGWGSAIERQFALEKIRNQFRAEHVVTYVTLGECWTSASNAVRPREAPDRQEIVLLT